MPEINKETRAINPELLSIPEIREAVELCEHAAYSAAELATYNQYWDTVSTEKTLLNERYTQGMAEGEAKGVANVAKQLLINGMDISTIAKVTGLTEAEIVKLKDLCKPSE